MYSARYLEPEILWTKAIPIGITQEDTET